MKRFTAVLLALDKVPTLLLAAADTGEEEWASRTFEIVKKSAFYFEYPLS